MSMRIPKKSICRNSLLRRPLSAKNEDEGDNEIDAMRRLLDASWNINTMGSVPTTPEAAADAAVQCIEQASAMKPLSKQLFFVKILLPQYDIRSGAKVYDEVLATGFCIHLAKRLQGKTQILLRDDKTVVSVNRVFAAREKNYLETAIDKVEDDHIADDALFYDDFADIGLLGVDIESTPSTLAASDSPTTSEALDDVETFRQQLITEWNEKVGQDLDADMDADVDDQPSSGTELTTPTELSSQHRLASMFGDAKLSTGADMGQSVISALSMNGKPRDDEGTIIILSASSLEDLIAVRSLVATYGATKRIILVNCSLDPIPRELKHSETIYSVMPLIAKVKVKNANMINAQKEPDNKLPPKVVVLRRYPRDWEIFVDSGDGFELVCTVPIDQVGKSGPSMEMIVGSVKAHLQSRFG
jgi:hypothetical protein